MKKQFFFFRRVQEEDYNSWGDSMLVFRFWNFEIWYDLNCCNYSVRWNRKISDVD